MTLTLGLVLAVALTAACLLIAALLAWGKTIIHRQGEQTTAGAIAAAGVLILTAAWLYNRYFRRK